MLVRKYFMPQNGQVVVLKCSPIWKKVRKSFKTLSELELKFISKASKREAIAHKTPLKSCSLKINRDSNSTFIIFSGLKTWVGVSWVGAYLWGFFQFQKREINYKRGYLCQA